MAADVCILLLLHLFKPLFEVHIRERSYTSRERVSYHIASGMLISYALHMNKHNTHTAFSGLGVTGDGMTSMSCSLLP